MNHHHDEPQLFGLSCVEPGAPAPVLAGVQASGRLDGVLFELTLSQTYRNASSRVLEVVYTEGDAPVMLVPLEGGLHRQARGQRATTALRDRAVEPSRRIGSCCGVAADSFVEAWLEGMVHYETPLNDSQASHRRQGAQPASVVGSDERTAKRPSE